MKKGAHLGTEVFGIPFDRHVQHTAGLNEKTLKQKQWIQYGHLLLFGKFSCKRSLQLLKGCRKKI